MVNCNIFYDLILPACQETQDVLLLVLGELRVLQGAEQAFVLSRSKCVGLDPKTAHQPRNKECSLFKACAGSMHIMLDAYSFATSSVNEEFLHALQVAYIQCKVTRILL